MKLEVEKVYMKRKFYQTGLKLSPFMFKKRFKQQNLRFMQNQLKSPRKRGEGSPSRTLGTNSANSPEGNPEYLLPPIKKIPRNPPNSFNP